MKNVYIGNPLDVMKEYINRTEYRSLSTMTESNETILGLSLDNGGWKGDAINHLKILSRAGNFVEGNISFGKGETYYFICYDGGVDVHEMKFDEPKLEFIYTKKFLRTYRVVDVTFYMMKCGFDLVSHLK